MKSVLIRKYGARLIGQPETEQIIIQSLRSQNKLWNALVEIEHRNHEAYAAIVTDSDAEFAALTLEHDVANATLDALYEQRNRKRAAMRTKKIEGADVFAVAISAQKQHLKEIQAAMKSCRGRAKEAARSRLETLEQQRREVVKETIRQAGLWWCHSELVATSFDAARAKALKTPGSKLNFHRFEGEGRIGVRFSPGIKLASPPATSLLKVREACPEELGHLKASRPGKQIKAVDIRIGKSDENNVAPTATFLVTIHDGMSLLGDTPLKTVTVKREMYAGKVKWFMVFMFVASETEEKAMPLRPKAVGIDFGWRQVHDKEFGDQTGLRVATIIDTQGAVEHVTLSPTMLARFERADMLRGKLDTSANEFWKDVSKQFSDSVLQSMDEKEWLRVLVEKARRAKRTYPGLMLSIAKAHALNPVLGDAADQFMQAWARSANRLNEVVFGTRRRVLEHRRHLYRNIAARLARECGLIAVKNINFRELSLSKSKDDEAMALHDLARANRVLASPSELRNAIIQAAKREQREIVLVDPAYQTATCSVCGHVHSRISADLFFVCANCGKLHDRDENSAKNTLQFAMEGASACRNN